MCSTDCGPCHTGGGTGGASTISIEAIIVEYTKEMMPSEEYTTVVYLKSNIITNQKVSLILRKGTATVEYADKYLNLSPMGEEYEFLITSPAEWGTYVLCVEYANEELAQREVYVKQTTSQKIKSSSYIGLDSTTLIVLVLIALGASIFAILLFFILWRKKRKDEKHERKRRPKIIRFGKKSTR